MTGTTLLSDRAPYFTSSHSREGNWCPPHLGIDRPVIQCDSVKESSNDVNEPFDSKRQRAVVCSCLLSDGF